MGMIVSPYQFGAAAFSPIQLSGLLAWYDATSGVYEDAGTDAAEDTDEVAQWNDQSGGNHHQSLVGGNGPIYDADGLNGLPSLNFSGAGNTGMVSGNIASGGVATAYIFMVMRINLAASDPFARLVSIKADGAGADFSNVNSFVFNKGDESIASGDSARVEVFQNSSTHGLMASNLTSDTPYRLSVVIDGTNCKIYLNNSEVSSGTLNDLDLGGPTNDLVTIAIGNDGGNDNLDGRVSELIVGNGTISSGNRASVDAYFAAKWGF